MLIQQCINAYLPLVTGTTGVKMTTVTSVVQQFVAGLKSRHEETRSTSARELKQYVSTDLKEFLPDDVSTFMDEFNHHILEMVSSQDTAEKKGGILAIGNFCQVVHHHHHHHFL